MLANALAASAAPRRAHAHAHMRMRTENKRYAHARVCSCTPPAGLAHAGHAKTAGDMLRKAFLEVRFA